MADWLHSLAHAPDGVLVMVALLAAVGLWMGFSGLRRGRLIEDVPTAKVRSAPQGYVELIGTAQALDGEPIIAPLSQTVCCWYSFQVQRRSDKHWRTEQSGVSDGLFILRDETGDCLIDPEGAEVSSRHARTWSDSGTGMGSVGVHARLPSLGRAADLVVNVGGGMLERLGSGIGEYRYQESVLLPGDPLYAIGAFRSLDAGGAAASLRELTAAILRDWKRQPDTLRERFDANRDGQVDAQEWERAREAAMQEASREQAAAMRKGQIHTLARPEGRGLFLLSNYEEFDLLSRLRWRKRLGFLAFAVLGSAALLMLSARI